MNFRNTIYAGIAAVAFATPAALFADDAKPAGPTPQEVQRLVQQNNAKASTFKRALEQIPNWHNDKTRRNAEFINSNATELVKLVKLPVGGATIVSEAGIEALVARAYAQPLNLKTYEQAKKHYIEAIRLSTKPSEKANLSWEYADYMYRAAMEGDTGQWNKAKKDAFALAGLEPIDKLNLLIRGIPDMDLEKEGWKIVEAIPALHARFFAECISSIKRAQGWQNDGGNMLSYAHSDERRLAIAEKAIDDPKIPSREKGQFYDAKFEALNAMERFAEAEDLLMMRAASTNANQRASASAQLGDFYVERAKRYYSDHEPSLLRKALAAYAVALAHDPKNGGYIRKQVNALMLLKNYDKAIERTDHWVELTRDKKPEREMLKIYAECWYYKGNYEKACEYYDQFDDNDRQLQRRYAESLYAIGRYDDAIAHIKRSYNEWSFKEANKYYIKKIEEKKAAEQAK